ncbi:CHC2 zinc finger domain-containing protein [uncultured Sphingomonas sp.]|uniref:CHC2 zinc finger domain-containing protein n=1 Tax=uncultured Sphingomonas sp. TaxID=158754 RepID=UPI00345B5171
MSHLADLRARARAEIPLVEFVAETVGLHATESAWRGACPLHPDSSLGLYVNDKQFFCFSCGAGGDVTDWWMRIHGTDEASAAAYLMRGVSGDGADHDKKPC